MHNKLEQDTIKVLENQKTEYEFVNSSAWDFVKKKFIEKIVANSSLNRIVIAPNSSNESVARELTARGLISTIALQWLGEVEGDAVSYEQNVKLFNQAEETEIISHFADK